MKGAFRGPAVFFRVMIAGMTSFLVMSVMSMALSVVTGLMIVDTGGMQITGSFIMSYPTTAYFYLFTEITAGIIAFVGSFMVLSRRE